MTRKLLIALVLVLCAPLDAALAAAPARTQGLLGISPPRRIVVAKPPVTLRPTLVQNTTDQTFKMTVFPALLTQRLDGSFDFDRSPRSLRAAQLILDVGPTKFELPPNRQINIKFRWANLPRGTRAVYTGLVVTGVPKGKPTSAVASILRLLGTNFFRLPGPYRSSGMIVSLRGEQAAPRRLRFITRVSNTGQVAGSPRRGVTVIEDSSGQVRARLPWTSGVILPRYQREFPVLLKKVLPAGHYTAISSMTFGRPARHSVKRRPFTLTGPNELPTRKLALSAVGLSGNVGDPAHLTATVRNTGTATSPVVLKIRLDRIALAQQKEIKVAQLRKAVGTLAVGKSATYSFDIGKLEQASYRATFVAGDGRVDFDERTANLTPRKASGFVARIWNWLKDALPWLLLLLALLAIVFLLLRRRRDEDEEEEDQPPAAPVPVAAGAPVPDRQPVLVPDPQPLPDPQTAPAPGVPASAAPVDGKPRVNINLASIDELTQLPGIGRRAAERIVDWREEYGEFASLGDLGQVDGFTPDRIRQLIGHAEF
ncbi:MAG TPA: helix-hairpin-helix domain-containing protein [Thermoleophilaceae bacterium]|nr:helix-hairpin-helix domain-containing protein [Thermoleophilaceae bacterium]